MSDRARVSSTHAESACGDLARDDDVERSLARVEVRRSFRLRVNDPCCNLPPGSMLMRWRARFAVRITAASSSASATSARAITLFDLSLADEAVAVDVSRLCVLSFEKSIPLDLVLS